MDLQLPMEFVNFRPLQRKLHSLLDARGITWKAVLVLFGLCFTDSCGEIMTGSNSGEHISIHLSR